MIGREELGFAEVTRLASVTDLEVPPEERRNSYETVILRRALSPDTKLYDWRRSIIDGKKDRRQVTIHQLDGPRGRIVNSWRLVRAWPCRWSGPSFDAQSSEVAVEELELAFDDLVWLRPRQRQRSRPTNQGA